MRKQKVTAIATLSQYDWGKHTISGTPPVPERASILESLCFFSRLLTQLAHKKVNTGAKLRVTIETVPEKKR